MSIVIPKIPNTPQLPLSVVIRTGRNLKGLLRCIKSIDANVEIIVSVADDAPFLSELKRTNLRIATHTYGNWSIAAQCGIDISSHSNVIIMDGADSTFDKGALELISNALSSGHLIVQPRVIFKTNNSLRSKLLSNIRTHENRFDPKSYSPGLGLNTSELVKIIGLNGDLYDRTVFFGDDGALNQRRKNADINVHVVSKAVVYHDPLTLKGELTNAFQFGIGEYQAQQAKGEIKTLYKFINNEFFSQYARNYYKSALKKYGLLTVLQMLRIQIEYIRGYKSKNQIKI